MLKELRQKPEEYRKKLALGLSSGFLFTMLSVWVYSNGFLGFSEPLIVKNVEDPKVLIDKKDGATSPIANTANTFGSLWGEIGDQYNSFKESLSNVLVPFITGIEVYHKSNK